MYSETVFLLLLISIQVSDSANFVNEGDECALPLGGKGICRKAYGCVVTTPTRGKTTQPLMRCGFSGRTELKCCALSRKLATLACRKIKAEVPLKSSYTISGPVRLAEPGEFPHMAALWYPTANNTTNWQCGGSLISSFFVLTAAHCLINTIPTKFRLGDLNLQSTGDDENARTFDIGEILVHPKYKPAMSRYNDIGLVKSRTAIPFSYFIYPACLHYREDPINQYSVVGWGSGDFNNSTFLHVNQPLKVAIVGVIDNKQCNNDYNKSVHRSNYRRGIVDHLICAKSQTGDRSGTCQGDSGGPLQYSEGDIYYITGVTAFGTTCGDDQPGIYTKVRKFVPWIETMVWGREKEPAQNLPRNRRRRD